MSKTIKGKGVPWFRVWGVTGAGIILSIGLGYLFLAGNHYSQLVGFFAYMSVACTLLPLPTPPYVIGLGKIIHPGAVALVGAVGNCIAAFAEYHIIIWLTSKRELQQRVEANRTFQRFSHYFRRAAFFCLVFTGFTPIPFEPFRLAGILIRYNQFKYLLAVFVGRFPRYYLIALIGERFQIPNRYLIIFLALSLLIPVVGLIVKKGRSVSLPESEVE